MEGAAIQIDHLYSDRLSLCLVDSRGREVSGVVLILVRSAVTKLHSLSCDRGDLFQPNLDLEAYNSVVV